MRDRNPEKERAFSSVFETLAILDEADKDEKSQVTFPPLNSVNEAKDWVDHNEK